MSRPRIRFDTQLHAAGELAESRLPPTVVRALAWWVAAELIRRHPRRLRVVEAHPISIYDCLSLIDLRRLPGPDAFIAHLNLEGHITLNADGLDLDNRFNWYEVLRAEDRRTYVVEQIERALGLRPPTSTPRTTSHSIGARCLARFAASAALSTRTWRIRAGFGFDSDDEPFRRELFAPFAILTSELAGGDIPDASHIWFLLDHTETPRTAMDIRTGVAWTSDTADDGVSLLRLYRSCGSNLDGVLSVIAPPIE